MIINVDCDGVLFPFTTEIEPFFKDAGHEMDLTSWNLGLGRDEFEAVFRTAIHNGLFARGEPIKGSQEAIRQLVDAGHRVRIVSSKILSDPSLTYLATQQMLRWLWFHDFVDLEIVVTGPKHGKKDYRADVVVDDEPSLKWVQPGSLNLLFDQPWNANPDSKRRTPWLYRAFGWEDVLKKVQWAADRSPVVV